MIISRFMRYALSARPLGGVRHAVVSFGFAWYFFLLAVGVDIWGIGWCMDICS